MSGCLSELRLPCMELVLLVFPNKRVLPSLPKVNPPGFSVLQVLRDQFGACQMWRKRACSVGSATLHGKKSCDVCVHVSVLNWKEKEADLRLPCSRLL
jgi:hypothetical protein